MKRLLIFLTITITFITVISSETSEGEEEKTHRITIFFEGLGANNISDDSIRVFYKTNNSGHGNEISGCKYDRNRNILEIPLDIEDKQISIQNCYLCFDNIEKGGYDVDHIYSLRSTNDYHPSEITYDLEGGGSEKVICYKLTDQGKDFERGNIVVMKQSKYTITGKVFTKSGGSSEPVYFNGVKVSLCDDKDEEVANSVSNNGEYSITYNAGGKYKIRCFSGYGSYEEEVRFDKNQKDYVVDVELKMSDALDIPHLLMIIGGVIAAIILIIAIIHRVFTYRTYKKVNSPFKR